MQSTKPTVYLSEDEKDLAGALVKELSGRYHVLWSETGAEAVEAALAGRVAVLVMDRKLKGADGLALVEQLRQNGNRTPVLMISAMGEVDDRVAGLRAGGDDYLVKPFAMAEFSARVDALGAAPGLRRGAAIARRPARDGPRSRKVCRDGREIDLLPREFKLLEYFMRRPGQVVTRQMLLEDIWNYRFRAQTNVVDVHIRNLRLKLDAPGAKKLIVNLRGEGFVLDVAA